MFGKLKSSATVQSEEETEKHIVQMNGVTAVS